jgi:hypothetical protein
VKTDGKFFYFANAQGELTESSQSNIKEESKEFELLKKT